MAKTPEAWKARFIKVVTSTSNPDAWNYTRMRLDDAVTCFNALGLSDYQLIVKDAVARDKVGKTMRVKKVPGCYFRVERK